VRDDDGRERLVRVEDLKVGDRVVVPPFDRVPGGRRRRERRLRRSISRQSPASRRPWKNRRGARVFAGTINGEGLLTRHGSQARGETTLAKIVQLVQEAQTTKSPTQVFTDRVERWYVPAVLMGDGAADLRPATDFAPHAWGTWFYRAMAFLTAASPCALAIGTPAAVLSGIARAARIGVLVKGGVHLENLGRIRVVAFDKTGTLTRGRPAVTEVIALDSMPADEVLALAAAVERTSSHPLADAIVAEARSRGLELREASDAQQIAGKGVTATVGGRRRDRGARGVCQCEAAGDATPVTRLAKLIRVACEQPP
jgi:Cd2+/Zn2+-exporting ATPase